MTSIEFPSELTDGRVTLRRLRESDVFSYVQAYRDDPDLGRLQGSQVDPDPDTALERVRRSAEFARAGDHIELAIVDAATGAFAGSLTLLRFDWGSRRCELGYWLAPGARGRGLMTAACTLVVDWALGELGLLRLEIATTPANIGSQNVARRLGFTQEALQRQRDVERGPRVDVIQFGLLREEWPPDRAAAGS